MDNPPRRPVHSPAPPHPEPAGHPGTETPGLHGNDDGREEKLAALRERLLAEAGAIRTAADWARCLRTAARLPGTSFANILLIQARQPDATMVQGYTAWQGVGRQVSRGEQGIEIFSAARGRPARAPRPGQGAEPAVPGWREADRVTYVWDISQTSGPTANAHIPLPAARGDPPAGLWDGLCWLARRDRVRCRARTRRPRRRRHLLGRAPHPRPARPGHQADGLGAGTPARPRADPRHRRPPAGGDNLRRRVHRNPESRSRRRRLHHLRPLRHHDDAPAR